MAPVGICRTDTSGLIKDAQSFVCKILRLRRKDLINTRLYDRLPIDQLECHLEMITTLVQTGRPFSIAQDYIAGDGSIQTVEVSMSLLRTRTGTPDGIIGIWQPVCGDQIHFRSLRAQPALGTDAAEYIASMLRELAVLGCIDGPLRKYLLAAMREAMMVDYEARVSKGKLLN